MTSTLLIQVESETSSFIIYLMMSCLFTQKIMLSTVNKCRFQKLSSVANLLVFVMFQAISDEAYLTKLRLIITFQWGLWLLFSEACHCFWMRLIIAFQQSCRTSIGGLETHWAMFGVFPDVTVKRKETFFQTLDEGVHSGVAESHVLGSNCFLTEETHWFGVYLHKKMQSPHARVKPLFSLSTYQ